MAGSERSERCGWRGVAGAESATPAVSVAISVEEGSSSQKAFEKTS